ncbi:hypothetical protein [Photorhabdus australis]
MLLGIHSLAVSMHLEIHRVYARNMVCEYVHTFKRYMLLFQLFVI